MSEEGKDSHHSQHNPPPPAPPQYGTYQGVANYPPPQPVIGFPQPIPPPGASDQAAAHYYAHGYQAVPGYAIAEGRPVRHQRLPCCGIGIGWFLFILGFIGVGIPWYVAAFVLLCAEIDPREKPGYIASTIAAVLATVALVLGLTNGDWD